MQTQGRLTTPEQFGNIVLRANPDGSRAAHHATWRGSSWAPQNMDSESRLNGNPAVAIGIYLAPGANAVQTAARVQRRRCDDLAPRFPDGPARRACSTTARPSSPTRSARCMKTLGEAFVLVVLVVFLFLGNLRATIIPTIAVPVSLIGTFAVLLALGFSANTVSLLAHGAGDRHRRRRRHRRGRERRAGDGGGAGPLAGRGDQEGDARRSPAPIIAITLVLLSVFVPIGFIPGLSGRCSGSSR